MSATIDHSLSHILPSSPACLQSAGAQLPMISQVRGIKRSTVKKRPPGPGGKNHPGFAATASVMQETGKAAGQRSLFACGTSCLKMTAGAMWRLRDGQTAVTSPVKWRKGDGGTVLSKYTFNDSKQSGYRQSDRGNRCRGWKEGHLTIYHATSTGHIQSFLHRCMSGMKLTTWESTTAKQEGIPPGMCQWHHGKGRLQKEERDLPFNLHILN